MHAPIVYFYYCCSTIGFLVLNSYCLATELENYAPPQAETLVIHSLGTVTNNEDIKNTVSKDDQTSQVFVTYTYRIIPNFLAPTAWVTVMFTKLIWISHHGLHIRRKVKFFSTDIIFARLHDFYQCGTIKWYIKKIKVFQL